MCLSIPGIVLEVDKNGTGKVNVNGNVVEANMALLDDVKAGDWVLLHAGFAIQKYDEQEALNTLEMLKEVFDGGDGQADGGASGGVP